MDRREALKMTSILIGGTVVGAQVFLSGCTSPKQNSFLITDELLLLLDDIGETILPHTQQSPGAKAAKIALFMKAMVNDCYSEQEAEIFIRGIASLNSRAHDTYNHEFLKLSITQKTALLNQLDLEAKNQKDTLTPHYFTMLKGLCIWGYFTSEVGATKALQYNPVPGGYKGCVPYLGTPAWA